jgi:hypothetical protein
MNEHRLRPQNRLGEGARRKVSHSHIAFNGRLAICSIGKDPGRDDLLEPLLQPIILPFNPMARMTRCASEVALPQAGRLSSQTGDRTKGTCTRCVSKRATFSQRYVNVGTRIGTTLNTRLSKITEAFNFGNSRPELNLECSLLHDCAGRDPQGILFAIAGIVI